MVKLILGILTVVIYSPVFWALYKSEWAQRDYTHAYFILPVAVFIVWTRRRLIGEAMREGKDCFAPAGLAMTQGLGVLIFGLLMFIFGWRQEYLIFQTLSFIFVLWGMVRFVYGPRVTRILRFPIFYLLLLVPLPTGVLDNITLPMRYGVSVVSAGILNLMQYPITRAGLLLTVGSQEIYMGEPCSGFRSLIAMVSLGLVYIYFVGGSRKKSLILAAALVPMALLGNLIRVVAMCLVTYHFGAEVGQGFYHYASGAVVFVVMVVGLMGLERALR